MKIKKNLINIKNPNTNEWEEILAIRGEKGEKGDKGDKGDDGLPSSIRFNGEIYTQEDGLITLPDISTDGLATEEYVNNAIQENRFSGNYNDLENRPVYEEIIEVDAITFDGIVKDTDELIGGFFVKVADEPAQIDEFIGKTMKIKNKDTEEETTKIIDSSLIEEFEPNVLYLIDTNRIVVAYDTIKLNPYMEFDKGIYFLTPSDFSSEYVSYLGISTTLQKIKRLDEKFLPNLVGECTTGKTFTVYDNIEDMNNNINGISAVAGENAEIFNSKDNIAVGSYSHAEGEDTIASGNVAHAEGYKCIANKNFSHAEGMCTFANGYVSHTEGDETVANGRCAHAEGQGTIASGYNQHVQGQFNIEDTEDKYAHIVGGGRRWGEYVDGEMIDIVEPKNIHTLDWNGNAWFQGNVSVDGTPTNNNDLATKKYVDDNKFSGDYNDLINTPCGDTREYETMTSPVVFDGDLTDKVVARPEDTSNMEPMSSSFVKSAVIPAFVKVADVAPIINLPVNEGDDVINEMVENGDLIVEGCMVSGDKSKRIVYEHGYIYQGYSWVTEETIDSYIGIYDDNYTPLAALVYEECIIDEFGPEITVTPGLWYTVMLTEDLSVAAYVESYSITSLISGEFKKLSREFVDYLPGLNVEGETFVVSTVKTGSDGYPEQVDDVERTAGEGSEIFNDYKNNKASGKFSHSEGTETMAVDTGAHAEGVGTKALGYASHAEGNHTRALGNGSHSEGIRSVAIGGASHSEGYETEANGERGHVEGANTKTARGTYYGHAEGYRTEANGQYASHAEGYCTKASSSYQHVQGKYNIEDAANTYAHIVGNGTSTSNRKNAHTLDWNGNAWFAGDVYIGPNNEILVTKAYVDEAIANASLGNGSDVSDSGVIEDSEFDDLISGTFGPEYVDRDE